jgi:anthranilate synthase component 1
MEIEKLREFAAAFPRVPVSKSLEMGELSTLEVFKILKNISKQCFILESMEDKEQWGRFTFIGYDPKLCLSCTNGDVSIKNGVNIQIADVDPRIYIKQMLDENRTPHFSELPPFSGGLVGYFSYDFIKYCEKELSLDAADEEGFKDADLMLFDKIIAFDRLLQKIVIIINIKTDAFEENYNHAAAELENIAALIQNGKPAAIPPLKINSPWRSLFDKNTFCEMVEKAKHCIFEGDIFQVVLSNRLDADAGGSLFDTYKNLRTINPSPYMFYFSSDEMEIAGASPETLVKLQYDEHGEGILHTFPLAGTAPRGKTEAEDLQLEKELLENPKELAEHNMLVDLGRNDIGKISNFGSVLVEKYMSIERFSHVMHIGSTVRGTICTDKSALDAIDAVLPAGTLSGAPKIRACEIINSLENNKRGIYGGAIGYIDFSGNMDTCIAIRIAYKKNGKVFVRSGAGIVADSIGENEFTECENKIKAVIKALEIKDNKMEK